MLQVYCVGWENDRETNHKTSDKIQETWVCSPKGWRGASGKPPSRLRRGETLCNIKGTTAQFVGSAGDAFSATCFLQKSRFTSSKPSISAIASDKKCIRHRTNSFVRYCPKSVKPYLRPRSTPVVEAEGVKGASADFVCFRAPLSRPQTRTPLRHKKNSKKDKTSLPMQRKF